MKRKPFAAFALTLACACLAFPFAACGETDDDNANSNNAPQGGTEQTLATKISEEAWKNAFSEETMTNVTMSISNNVTLTDGEEITESIVMKRDGDKLSQNVTSTRGSAVMYIAKEGDKFYLYHESDKGWQKSDSGDTSFEEYMGTYMFYNRYAEAAFNAETDEYTLPSAEDDTERDGVWTIKFEDGKACKLEFVGTAYMYDGEPFETVYSTQLSDYGTTEVTLPQATLAE